MTDDPLDDLANEIEQGFMQGSGWKTCRYLLGKLATQQRKEVDRLQEVVDSNDSLIKIYSIAQERDEAVAEVQQLRALTAQHLA